MKSIDNIFDQYLVESKIFQNKEALSEAYIPEVIFHRKKEIVQLAKILAPSLRLEKPSNVFIYGKTGTGKTLVTRYVCAKLLEKAKSRNIPLHSLWINCKLQRVSDTEYRVIAQLTRQLGINVPFAGLSTNEVYKRFFSALDRASGVTLVVLDEVDRLVKKCGDDFLYNLTRLNEQVGAKLSFIGITNQVTLLKQLEPRVRSSLGEEEIVFSPYNAAQLRDILEQRARLAFKENAITPAAIAKCAAYAAKEHGDARKAIELLRVAGEVAERAGIERVEEEHIALAYEKLERDAVIELLKTLPRQSQLVFIALASILRHRSTPIYTGEVYDVYKGLCVKIGIHPLTRRRVSDLISEIESLGLIEAKTISKGRYGRTREIKLSIPWEIADAMSKLEQ